MKVSNWFNWYDRLKFFYNRYNFKFTKIPFIIKNLIKLQLIKLKKLKLKNIFIY